MDNLDSLKVFVRESNRIEGIIRAPTKRELQAHADLLAVRKLGVVDIEAFVAVVAPGKPLRRQSNMNVYVGQHVPIQGGPHVEGLLQTILDLVAINANPYDVHQKYEHLHPFMDGNGRSGRAIWLWQMLNQQHKPHPLGMGFLHLWYYQSLQATRSGDRP